LQEKLQRLFIENILASAGNRCNLFLPNFKESEAEERAEDQDFSICGQLNSGDT
jgi:hypothetical protein